MATVLFEGNGGIPSIERMDVTYGEPYGTLPTAIYAGYEFLGWFTAQYGGDEVTSEDIVPFTGSRWLYAHWQAKTFTVTFDGNGGAVDPASKTVTYGQPYGTLPAAYVQGNRFIGWFTEAIGGTQITSETVANRTVAQTLYAHYESDAILRIASSGTVTTASQIYVVDSGTVTRVTGVYSVTSGVVKRGI